MKDLTVYGTPTDLCSATSRPRALSLWLSSRKFKISRPTSLANIDLCSRSRTASFPAIELLVRATGIYWLVFGLSFLAISQSCFYGTRLTIINRLVIKNLSYHANFLILWATFSYPPHELLMVFQTEKLAYYVNLLGELLVISRNYRVFKIVRHEPHIESI